MKHNKNNNNSSVAGTSQSRAPRWQEVLPLPYSRKGDDALVHAAAPGGEVMTFLERRKESWRREVADALNGRQHLLLDGRRELRITGWGHLTGKGLTGLALSTELALQVVRSLGRYAEQALNGEREEEKKNTNNKKNVKDDTYERQ